MVSIPSRVPFLPNVLLPGLVLLIAGAAAFAAQRHRRVTSQGRAALAANSPL